MVYVNAFVIALGFTVAAWVGHYICGDDAKEREETIIMLQEQIKILVSENKRLRDEYIKNLKLSRGE